jgi:hypothetical protein
MIKKIGWIAIFLAGDFLRLIEIGVGYFLVLKMNIHEDPFFHFVGWSVFVIEYWSTFVKGGLNIFISGPIIAAIAYFFPPWPHSLFWALSTVVTLNALWIISFRAAIAFAESDSPDYYPED